MDGGVSLSVLLPNYNHARYIGQALTAMLHQSVPAAEIIVVDDASTDQSVPLIQSIADSNPSVRFFRNDQNRGWFYSNGLAFTKSTGNYIYCASADDLILPGFFERSLQLLQRYPQAALCCAFHSTLDDRTGRADKNPTYLLEREGYLAPREFAAKCWGGGIPGHTSIMRRAALLQAGGFLTPLKWHCDWFANLVMAFRRGCCFIPETLALIRMLPQSFSAAGSRGPEQRQVLAELLRLLLSPEYKDVLPLFQTSGVLSCYGAQLIRAAVDARMHDNPQVLALLQQQRRKDYDALLADEDTDVRRVAELLRRESAGLVPRWLDGLTSNSKRNWSAQRLRNPVLRSLARCLLSGPTR